MSGSTGQKSPRGTVDVACSGDYAAECCSGENARLDDYERLEAEESPTAQKSPQGMVDVACSGDSKEASPRSYSGEHAPPDYDRAEAEEVRTAQKSPRGMMDVACSGDSKEASPRSYTAECYLREDAPPGDYEHAEAGEDPGMPDVPPEEGSPEEHLDDWKVPVFSLVEVEDGGRLVTRLHYVSYKQLLEDLLSSQ